MLLVLEDCHWADTPSLLLLRHLAHTATDVRILVLATFRDTEADVPAELADTLANRRMGAATWVAHTAYEYGRLLAATGELGRSAALLTEASMLAARIGMPTLLARVGQLGETTASSLPNGLSAREVAVLRLVAQGRSNREIGAALFISEHTAANHIRSILRKTASANRTEAAAYAYRRGLAAD